MGDYYTGEATRLFNFLIGRLYANPYLATLFIWGVLFPVGMYLLIQLAMALGLWKVK
jgi:hypothetical protein